MSPNSKKYLFPIAVAGALTAFTVALPAFVSADTNSFVPPAFNAGGLGVGAMMGARFQGGGQAGQGRGMMNGTVRAPGVFGTVTAINGTSITITSMTGRRMGQDQGDSNNGSAPAPAASVTYTVDASAATVTKSGAASTLSAVAVGDKVMVLGTVSGTSITAKSILDGIGGGNGGPRGGMTGSARQGIFGSVTAINGSSLTVTGSTGRPNASTTTSTAYIVDASSAKVSKNGAASTLSAVAVGDKVLVLGTVSGTSVTATSINDGIGGGRGAMKGIENGNGQNAPATSPIQGNGQPIIGGSVTAISGSTLTVTNASNIVYTVNASSVTVTKAGVTTSLSNVAVGDQVIVQGAVNGNSITASSIIDSGAAGAAPSGTDTSGQKPPRSGGVFGGIGSFFKHLFGF